MKNVYWLLLALCACAGPAKQTTEQPTSANAIKESNYLRWVGDSEFDSLQDDANFKLCSSEQNVIQYFNVGAAMEYEGEKPVLVRHFKENYQPVDTEQSGLIRIRFVVNCNGETGRFRLTQSNFDYKEITFDQQITEQLLSLTKALNGWKTKFNEGQPADYYQYLIFKIQKGDLTEIMP